MAAEFITLTLAGSHRQVTVRAAAVIMVTPGQDGYGRPRTLVRIAGVGDEATPVTETVDEVRWLLGIAGER